MRLRPYSEYKDSDLLWIRKIPIEWKVLRAKFLLQERDQRWTEEKGNLLSVSQYTGVNKRRIREGSDAADTRAESLIGYKVVYKNDLVINIMLAWNGSLGVAPMDGIVSPAYCVYLFKDGLPWYFHNLLRCAQYRAEIKRRSRGVVDSRLRFYTDDLYRLPLLIPSLDEQNRIVCFLSWKNEKINKFIRNKHRLIELLKEQKQNIINQAVTRGLDPNVKLKSSGVEWIGGIPDSWHMLSIKRLVKTKMADGPHETPNFVDKGVPFISAEAILNGRVNFEKRRADISYKDHEKYCEKVRPQLHDIFIVKSGSTTGKCCIVDVEENFSIWSPLALVRVNKSIIPYFMFFALSSNCFQQQVQEHWSFGTQPNIGMGVLENLKIACPESIEEQSKIVDFIFESLKSVDQAIIRIEREITLIREYHTRLISDVVTGKVDVHNIAIPSITEESLNAINNEVSEVG